MVFPFKGNVPKLISSGEKWTHSASDESVPTTFWALLGALRIFAEMVSWADSPGFKMPSLSVSLVIFTIEVWTKYPSM